MKERDEKTSKQMRQAAATYAGPVTRCPPGRARAPAKKAVVMNASVEWLRANWHVQPVRNPKTARQQIRVARAQQKRIAKRNAPLLKRINKKRRLSLTSRS